MFYERLNKLCNDRGTTISVVSTRDLHCSNSTATGWKKGASPNSSVVVAAAKLFDVSTDYLLGLTDNPSSRPSKDEGMHRLSADEEFLIEKLRSAETAEQQKAMICALVVLGANPNQDQLPSLRIGSQGNGQRGRSEKQTG